MNFSVTSRCSAGATSRRRPGASAIFCRARALIDDDLLGCKVELSGPQSLTQQEMVGVIGETIGRSLTYREVAPEVARQGLIVGGLPDRFVDALLRMLARSIDHPARVTDEVAKILGRPALPYAEWVADNKEAFQR